MERLYYLFYRIIKTERKNGQPFFNVYMGLSFLEYMNVGSIFGIVNYFLKYRIPKNMAVSVTFVFFGFILLYNYFSLWLKKEEIVSKYKKLPNKNGSLLIWGFIIFSFCLFYIVLEYFVDYHK